MEDNKANRFRFRAWDSNRNIMLLPDIKDDAGLDEWYGGEWPIFNVILECVQKGGWTLMQSTGLLDKNGKEIFEGDILKDRDSSGDIFLTVVWWNEAARFSFQRKEGWHWEVFFDPENPSKLIYQEICGNIYENGDLLK